MKVNSIGVNAYQQMNGDLQANRKPPKSIDKQETVEKAKNVHIPGQGNNIGSKISVHLKGENFIDMLSPEEKQAVELLFEKFKDRENYGIRNKTETAALGNLVDVKL